MKIAIDVSQIVYGTGVSQYTIELVKNLLRIDKENEYILFAGAFRRKSDILKIFPQTKVFPIPPVLMNIVWNRFHTLPIEKLIGKVDVIHTSDWAEPPSSTFKVTTVHDLAPFLYPSLFPRDMIRNIVDAHKAKLKLVEKESDRILVPATATKKDLVKLGFKESIIRVTPESVSGIFKRPTEVRIEEVKRKHKIFGDYILCVGVDPRKNTERTIKAFEHASTGKELKLVFVGIPKYMTVKESRNVRMIGRGAADEMPALYSGAKALVYASLYEGFGLPILEAFACGTPVVTSNISSMPEVAGGAAVLVDPYDVNSIAEGIKKALDGPKGLIEKGIARVKDFSWEKTAKMTLNVYNEARK